MARKFKCDCNSLVIILEGIKKEYISRVYGPCEKYVAICPDCGKEIDELIEPKSGKGDSAPSCGGGCCGCSHSH